MAARVDRWLARAGMLAGRATDLALEEVRPLLSKRSVANAAGAFMPSQGFTRTRTALLRLAGVRIGPHSLVQGPIRFTGACEPRDLHIGALTLITGDLHIDLGAPIFIGDQVRIGHSVTLLTVDHAIGEPELRAGVSRQSGIEIGDGAWLASRVVVLPGVKVGAGSVVAAGAVVTRDVTPDTLVAGIPARVIRPLPRKSQRTDDFGGYTRDE